MTYSEHSKGFLASSVLNGAEKPLIKVSLLVGNVLANTVTNRDTAVLEFQHTHGNAIHITVTPIAEVTIAKFVAE